MNSSNWIKLAFEATTSHHANAVSTIHWKTVSNMP